MIFVRQIAYIPLKMQASERVFEFLEAMGERFRLKTLMYKFRGKSKAPLTTQLFSHLDLEIRTLQGYGPEGSGHAIWVLLGEHERGPHQDSDVGPEAARGSQNSVHQSLLNTCEHETAIRTSLLSICESPL